MKNLYKTSLAVLAMLTLAACGGSGTSYIPVAASSGTVAVKNSALPTGTRGTPYTMFLGASGGTPPYKWSIVTGNLPSGLTLSLDGIISGTPNVLGSFTVVFKIADSSSPALEAQKPLQINVSTLVSAPSTTGAGLYEDHCAWCHFDLGSANQQHRGATLAQVKAAIAADTGGMGEFGPSGVFSLSYADLTLIVAAMSASTVYITPSLTTTTLPAATVGVAYSQPLTAKNGTPSYKWSTMGGDPLPTGLILNSGSGVVAGTPTTAGTYNVVFMLEDANPNTMVHQTIAVTVNASVLPPDGAALYATKCAGCHSLGTVDPTSGGAPNLSGKGSLVNGKFASGSHNGNTLTSAEIAALTAYFNAN